MEEMGVGGGKKKILKDRLLASAPREPTSNEKYTNLCSDLMAAAPTTAVGAEQVPGGAALGPLMV